MAARRRPEWLRAAATNEIVSEILPDDDERAIPRRFGDWMLALAAGSGKARTRRAALANDGRRPHGTEDTHEFSGGIEGIPRIHRAACPRPAARPARGTAAPRSRATPPLPPADSRSPRRTPSGIRPGRRRPCRPASRRRRA